MIELARIVELIQILVLPAGSWAIHQLSQILSQLRSLNGRMAKMEGWQEHHESLDTERFKSLHDDIQQQRARCDDFLGGHNQRR